MIDPEEANDPGAGNTEAAQKARVEGAILNCSPEICSAATDYADGHGICRTSGCPVVPLDDDADPPRTLSFADLLEVLGLTEDEFIAVCHKPVDGSFSTQVALSSHAADAVASVPARSCVWFTPNPTAGPERRTRAGAGNVR